MSVADIFASPQLYTFDGRPEALRGEAPFADAEIIEVDVTISEEYVHGFELSTNPVEKGIDVADHKRRKPVMLRMSGIVTDSPNNVLDVMAGNLSGTLGATRDDAGNEVDTRSRDAYERLRAMAARTDPIKIVTRQGVYDSMTFTSFTVQKNDAGRYLGFSAVLEEIRFATPLFGTFSVEVEHTAEPPAAALKQPPQIDNESILRNVQGAGDAAVTNTAGGFTDKLVSGVKAAFNAGFSVKGGP